MKTLEYENKMIDETLYKTTKIEKRTYTVLSPNGDKYIVPSNMFENFKEMLSIDKHWIIK